MLYCFLSQFLVLAVFGLFLFCCFFFVPLLFTVFIWTKAKRPRLMAWRLTSISHSLFASHCFCIFGFWVLNISKIAVRVRYINGQNCLKLSLCNSMCRFNHCLTVCVFVPLRGKIGTVGAVAVDAQSNIACATSTGGMLNKMEGRVGDTACIGESSLHYPIVTHSLDDDWFYANIALSLEFVRVTVHHEVV